MRHDADEGCLACELTSGKRALPGGRIYETNLWIVEHTIGPLPAGTLILKPLRHCLTLAEIEPEEAEQLGPLLNLISYTITELTRCDQVYSCLWSHAGWTPGHIHFVLQPAWDKQREKHERPGPFAQVDMFSANEQPNPQEVEEFARRARALLDRIMGR